MGMGPYYGYDNWYGMDWYDPYTRYYYPRRRRTRCRPRRRYPCYGRYPYRGYYDGYYNWHM